MSSYNGRVVILFKSLGFNLIYSFVTTPFVALGTCIINYKID